MEGAEQIETDVAAARHLVAGMPDGIEDQRPARIRHKRHSLLQRFRISRAVDRAASKKAAPAFDSFRAALSGALPAADAGGVILAACNDYYYWQYARSLVASLERAGQAQAVHLHLCEPQAAVLANIQAIADRLRAVALSWTIDPCPLAKRLSHRTIYYAASRFLLAPLILQQTGAPLLAVDVDGIAVQPVWSGFAELMRDADIAVVERPEERKPTMKVLASAFGFNATPEGIRFATGLAHALASVFALRPRYHVDQIAIHMLLERARRTRSLRVAAMPKRFWDHDFGADAALWTAKGWTRKDSDAFQGAKRQAEDFLAYAPAPRGLPA